MYEKPFMVNNWDSVDWGSIQLQIYEVDTNGHVEEGFCADHYT